MEPEMVYVQRETDQNDPCFGMVKGVYRQLQPGYAEEAMPADAAEVRDFHNRMAELVARNAKRG